MRRAILDLTPKDAVLSARVTDIGQLYCDVLGNIHTEFADEIGSSDPENRLRQCAHLIQGLASQTAMRKDKTYFSEEPDEFARMMVLACQGLLDS